MAFFFFNTGHRRKLALATLIIFNHLCSFGQLEGADKRYGRELAQIDSICHDLRASNDSMEIDCFQWLVKRALEEEDYDKAGIESRIIIQDHIGRGEIEDAFTLIEEMLSYERKFTDPATKAHLLLKRGGAHFTNANFSEAVNDYQNCILGFLTPIDSIFAADAYFFSGQAYSNLDNFSEAAKNLEESYKIYEILGDTDYMLYVGSELGIMYSRSGLTEAAERRRIEMIELCESLKAYNHLGRTHTDLGIQYVNEGKIAEAGEQYKIANEVFATMPKEEINERDYLILLIQRIAFEIRQDNLEKARELREEIEQSSIHQMGLYFSSMLDYLDALYNEKTGNLSEAVRYARKYYNSHDKGGHSYTLLNAEELLARVLQKNGEYKEANEILNAYVVKKDSVDRSKAKNIFAYHQTRFEAAEKEARISEQEAQILKLENEQNATANRRNLFIVIISAISAVAFGIWFHGKNKNKMLEMNLAQSKNDLEVFTNEMLLRSAEHESLSKELNSLKIQMGSNQSIENVEELLSSKILTKKDWFRFKDKFESVYPNFLTDIQKKGYDLTESQVRLVCLEKLGMNTGEIANLLGISFDSVVQNRYRLRKKISAPKEIPLVNFLE
ncbi:MAG: hypothetical protein AAF487_01180 [Bacteroidota bacterium]